MKKYLLPAVIALLAASIYVVSWFYGTQKEIKKLAGNEKILHCQTPEPKKNIVRYGMNLTGYQLLTCLVQPSEIIADIFAKHCIATSLAHSMVQESKQIFDPKKIRAGNPYTVVLQHTDTGMVTKKIIYEEDKINFVVFNFGDTNYIYRGKHLVERKKREVGGMIKNSLYETLDAQHLPSVLAVQMAEIFSCVIDFYRIQPNDYFKIIYDEDFAEGQSVGISKIYACAFSHAGKEYKAFYFQKNEAQPGEFYDEKGESMKRQFLKAPLKFFRISSRYSSARLHPVTKVVKAHLGTDYAAPHGTPIMATAEGVVEEAQFKVHNGNYVKIRHNGQYKTQYLHMSKFAPGIKAGKKVRQGEVIGYVGSTGLASGPHVCYRFWRDGKQVDPLKQKISFSEPLAASYRADFFKSIEPLQQKLETLPIPPSHETSVTAYVSSSQNLRKSR